jgi:hypothetical protein
MGAVLFIHPDRAWREKIKQEIQAGEMAKALFFETVSEAYESIGNSALPVSAIYLSVKNQKSSVLAALEFCIVNRPVTPVFLLDQAERDFIRDFRVRGAFEGAADLKDLFAPLNRKALATTDFNLPRPMGTRKNPEFIAIPTADFRALRHYPDDVYILHPDGGMKLFASRGTPVDQGYLEQAMKFSNWLHIREASCSEARENLRNAKHDLLNLRGIGDEWIRTELLVEAKTILNRLRSEMPSDPVIARALSFLNGFARYLSILNRNPGSKGLFEFIRSAGETDRSLLSLSYALLLCSYFRFEQNAVVEILGLSCLLQDISLIHSPFGNIADLPADKIPREAMNFYQRHPAHSADLLAGATSLSAATLQVIRQHHETKNHKGFPNKIGGSRLHPMAENLSLLNRFLDLRETGASMDEIRVRLEREVYPGYSVEAVSALNSVILRLGSGF